MDARACYDLLKRLDTDSLSGASHKYLEQSCRACQAGNWQQMLELARSYQRIAPERKNHIGQAAALIHLGLAYAQEEEYDKAVKFCQKAKRIYHRSPDQRHNEGIVAYGLGLIYQQHKAPSKAISCYEEALSLLEEVRNGHAAAGNNQKFEGIQTLCDGIRERIESLMS